MAPQQVFAWRRQAVRRAQLGRGEAPGSAFAAVEVDATAADGVVEISVAGAVLRIGPTVPVLL